MKRQFLKKIHIRSAAVLLSLLLSFGMLLVWPETELPGVRAETPVWNYGYSNPCTTAAEIDAAFPASYTGPLKALLKAHPTWSFQAFYTGTSWERCFLHDADYLTNSEMYYSRNLIEYDTMPSSWYSTDVKGAFSWAANTYTVMSAPNWIQASEEAVRYMMDPRNFMNEEQIFQFMDQTATSSLEAVQQVFAQVTGSNFWVRSGENADLYWEEEVEVPPGETVEEDDDLPGGDGEIETVIVRHYLTYAEAMVKIGEEIGVNPVALATRVINEQGRGESPLISGTQSFTLENGETIDGGYYNYFNLQATDGMEGASMERIITNGLREAYAGGWDTRYKALYGGAAKYAATYIHRGQNTIYQQKYSVDSRSTGLFWRQYMQAILAPYVAARASYNSYRSAGILNDSIRFLIPVFDQMPDLPEPRPVKDGNPNYKLGAIYVNGTAVPDFDTDILEYTVETGSNNAHLFISAYAGTTTMSVSGSTGTGTLVTDIALSPGTNTVSILSTAENGDTRTYTLYINRTNATLYYGDVNSDGTIDALDLAYTASYLLGNDVLTPKMKEAADINGDGSVDIQDLSYIVSYLLGYIEQIPQRGTNG